MSKSKIPWIPVLIVIAVAGFALYSAKDIGPTSQTPTQETSIIEKIKDAFTGGGGGGATQTRTVTSSGITIDVEGYDINGNKVSMANIPTQAIVGTTPKIAYIGFGITIENKQTSGVPLKNIRPTKIQARGVDAPLLINSFSSWTPILSLNPGETSTKQSGAMIGVEDFKNAVGGYGDSIPLTFKFSGEYQSRDPSVTTLVPLEIIGPASLRMQPDTCNDGTPEGTCSLQTKGLYCTKLTDTLSLALIPGATTYGCGCDTANELFPDPNNLDMCTGPKCSDGTLKNTCVAPTDPDGWNSFCNSNLQIVNDCTKCPSSAQPLKCNLDAYNQDTGVCNPDGSCTYTDQIDVGVGITQSESTLFSFDISNSGAKTVNAGSSVTNIISTATGTGSGTVSFSASGLSSGMTASFSPTSCTVPCSTTLTLSTLQTTPTGTSTITVTGTPNSGVTKSTSFQLTVAQPQNVIFRTNVPNGLSAINTYNSWYNNVNTYWMALPYSGSAYSSSSLYGWKYYSRAATSGAYVTYCPSAVTSLCKDNNVAYCIIGYTPDNYPVRRQDVSINNRVTICAGGSYYMVFLQPGSPTSSVPELSKIPTSPYNTNGQEKYG